MTHTSAPQPLRRNATALRDPAWVPRLFWSCAGAVMLVPLLIAAEFKPWVLWNSESASAMLRFVAGFAPPAHEPHFLALVARETWRTVAIATAGVTLALALAAPMALACTRVLSLS